MPRRSEGHRRRPRHGGRRRAAGPSRARPFDRRQSRRAGRDARRGGRNPRHRRIRRTPHRSARLAFEMGGRRARSRARLQDLRDGRTVLGDQGPHDRRRLRQGGAAGRAGKGVCEWRFAGSGRLAWGGERRTSRRAVRRAQPAADGQARGGRGRRLSVRPPHRGGDRRGAPPLPDEARLAGAEPLVARYLAAFAALGLAARPAPPRAAARGLHVVARQAALV